MAPVEVTSGVHDSKNNGRSKKPAIKRTLILFLTSKYSATGL